MLTDISNVIGVHNIKNDVQYEAINGSNATKLLGQFSGFNKYAGLSIGFSARSKSCSYYSGKFCMGY
jgi:hypothetical protein